MDGLLCMLIQKRKWQQNASFFQVEGDMPTVASFNNGDPVGKIPEMLDINIWIPGLECIGELNISSDVFPESSGGQRLMSTSLEKDTTRHDP